MPHHGSTTVQIVLKSSIQLCNKNGGSGESDKLVLLPQPLIIFLEVKTRPGSSTVPEFWLPKTFKHALAIRIAQPTALPANQNPTEPASEHAPPKMVEDRDLTWVVNPANALMDILEAMDEGLMAEGASADAGDLGNSVDSRDESEILSPARPLVSDLAQEGLQQQLQIHLRDTVKKILPSVRRLEDLFEDLKIELERTPELVSCREAFLRLTTQFDTHLGSSAPSTPPNGLGEAESGPKEMPVPRTTHPPTTPPQTRRTLLPPSPEDREVRKTSYSHL
ncbi:hypothetical protein M407DRAFT_11620 [Tulasnella calospora MUT 4182]|uniref:Uncharacterized protein n=1 Tax=Tulasnella calospora MUT 4182 TaxID=1051891 RepID=A0A0C3PVJ5_9AGAM|nr:hypothetical protein M407DRAFT_11620 [Tulasnella calospora MUT 4182]